MSEVVLEEKEPSEELTYLRTDWQELSEMGPQFECLADPYDINFDETYWKNRLSDWSNVEIKRLTGWIDSNRSAEDLVMNECPKVSPNQLNSMQRLAFEIVKNHFQNRKQLLMIILGAAGSGKTFTIHAISTYLQGNLKRAAPTAKAAFLINGDTVHQLLSIRVNEGNTYIPLKDDSLRKLQDLFVNITHIIIDEYSMLSQVMLARIDERMRQITQKLDKFFGGLSLILTGDPGQLPPVCASCLFDKRKENPLSTRGLDAYQEFKNVIQLTQVMRQLEDGDEDQQKFIDLLPRLRTGENTLDDYDHLKKRFIGPLNSEEFKDTTRIFALNEQCEEYNKARLETLKNPITRLSAKNEPKRARNYDADLFRGLSNTIYLCVGAKVL